MRIVYDTGMYDSRIPRSTNPRKDGGVDVLVVRTNRTRELESEDGIRISGTDYEVRISKEALERDREVHDHERKHLETLGGYAASGIMYDTVTGPGGESVAVGGKIAVDLNEIPGDPAATLRKAKTIMAAAQAPGSPSAADLRVANRARQLATKAQKELSEELKLSTLTPSR